MPRWYWPDNYKRLGIPRSEPLVNKDFVAALKGKQTREERYEALLDYFDLRDTLEGLKAQMRAKRAR